MKSKSSLKLAPNIRQLTFPEDEKKHPWLSVLLHGYYLVDQGVAEAIRQQEKKDRKLACAKGCHACCVTHQTIPVYPMELVGITWYLTEKCLEPIRGILITNLKAHKKGDPCAFLVDGACAIHPLRPMACRQFNVFDTPCKAGEDAFYTRRGDVLTPIREYADAAFLKMLPFYGVQNKAERRDIIKKGTHHDLAKDMQFMNWETVAAKMIAWDAAHAS